MIDEIKALFIDKNYIEEPLYKFRRIDIKGRRNYIKVYPDGKAFIAPSVTTIMNETLKMSPFLLKWMIDNGQEKIAWFKEQSANYGTFLHSVLADILRGGDVSFDPKVNKEKFDIFYNTHREGGFDALKGWEWCEMKGRDMAKDFYGFLRWAKEYQVKPLAIEYPIMSDKTIGWYCLKNKYKWFPGELPKKCETICQECENYVLIKENAGCIDLVCRATIDGQEKICLVDFKSGLNGFYKDQRIQVAAYASLWNSQHPDKPTDHIFLWSPHDFKLPAKANTKFYCFKDQTGKVKPRKWELCCEQYAADNDNFPFEPKTIFNPGNYGISDDISDEVVFFVYDEIQEIIEETRKKFKDEEF